MPFYVTILVVMDSNFLKFKGLEQGFEIFAHWQHIHRSDVEQQMEIVYCFVKFVKCKLLQGCLDGSELKVYVGTTGVEAGTSTKRYSTGSGLASLDTSLPYESFS
ncbi:hypothetical protein HUJ05_010283 [Dendroctonus ponderosae]|nr:hypothetical protein HUJ05_010283 [Dendroctonus ponderosae]